VVRSYGLGFRVKVLGFRIQDLRFSVEDPTSPV
jgi:hypothetical protein